MAVKFGLAPAELTRISGAPKRIAIISHVQALLVVLTQRVEGQSGGLGQAGPGHGPPTLQRLNSQKASCAGFTPRAFGSISIGGDHPIAVSKMPGRRLQESVREGKLAIREGEVFQVVLSQRLDLDCPAEPLDVYRVLRASNPSPYMYLLTLENRRPSWRIPVGAGLAFGYAFACRYQYSLVLLPFLAYGWTARHLQRLFTDPEHRRHRQPRLGPANRV